MEIHNHKGITVIDIVDKGRCLSCFGCFAACRQGALTMSFSETGFYQPSIDLDKCKQCGACKAHCPVCESDSPLRAESPKNMEMAPCFFSAWTKNTSIRLNSSSGGVYSEIALDILGKGGTVYACAWDESMTAKHVRITDASELSKTRGSKYVCSYVGDVYRQIARESKEKQVLFVGTPCQCAALNLHLTVETRRNVLVIDLVCYGAPSPAVFEDYKQWIFDGDDISCLAFRKKYCGWRRPVVEAESLTRRRYVRLASMDPYFQMFIQRISIPQVCDACHYAKLPREGDLTL